MADSNPKPVQKPEELYKVGDRVRLNSKANDMYKVAREGSEGVITHVIPEGGMPAEYNLEFDFPTTKIPQNLQSDTRFWRIRHDCCDKIADAGEVQGKREDNELEGLVASEQTSQTGDKPTTEPVVKTYLL